MSEENVEILRAFYEAFNRRLFDDALQYLHSECEAYPALPAPGEAVPAPPTLVPPKAPPSRALGGTA